MDDEIASFTSITGASTDRAAQYLRLTENDLAQAIQLFFDSPNLELPAAPAQAPAPESAPTAGRSIPSYNEDENGVVHLDDDDDDLMSDNFDMGTERANVPAASSGPALDPFEDDEAMARRLQAEFYESNTNDVRAPMARTTETLVGPGAYMDEDDAAAAVAEQLARRRRPGRPGIFNQRAGNNSIWDNAEANPSARDLNLSQATGGASDASAKSNHLAQLYRPPFDIMCRKPWDEAREEGKITEKWLLVNVQDSGIFDCQVLNRDIWKDTSIKETIKENFVFLQWNKDDPAGQQYINYYFHARDSQDAYPHIAIVDPRTGEQVKVWSGRPTPKAADFLMQLHEFLDRYSLKANVRNPVATRKAEKPSKDVYAMSEEEMLEMALKNSMENNGGPKDQDPDELTKAGARADSSKGKERAVETPSEPVEAPASSSVSSVFARISAGNVHTEPPNDPASTTRIQFRHSGGRVIRRFALDDPVRRIYEWLKASPPEGREGLEFELVFMGKNLIDVLESSIQDAGLKNGSVMVEFLGD